MGDNPVIIIGGGLAGVTTFYEMVSRGYAATMLDAAPRVADGASHANGGVLHPSLPDPWNNPGIGRILAASLFSANAPMKLHWGQLPDLFAWGLSFLRNSAPSRHQAITRSNFDLAHYSTRQTDALMQLLNLQFEHATPGTLKLLRSDKDKAEAIAMADMLAKQGLRYELLDRQALLQREPTLAQAQTPPVGALYFADDRVGNARLFCEALLRQAEARGGKPAFDCKVEALCVEQGRVVGARLANGEVLRGDVILCAGAQSTHLAKQAGLTLAIRPAKGYSLTLSAEHLSDQLTHPLVDPQLHIAVTPLGDKIRILGMAEFIGFDTQIAPQRLHMLRRFFEQLLPDMATQLDWQSADAWAGLRPMSADGRPYIGASSIEGLWLNCGHGHLGWTMAVGSARILVDSYLGCKTEINAAPFKPVGQGRAL